MSNDIPESSDGGGYFPTSQATHVKQWARVVQDPVVDLIIWLVACYLIGKHAFKGDGPL